MTTRGPQSSLGIFQNSPGLPGLTGQAGLGGRDPGTHCSEEQRPADSELPPVVQGQTVARIKLIINLNISSHHQADPNIPNNFGKFPLHLAVENNLLSVVQLLLNSGVDVEARDQVSGKTALHLAVERQLEEMVNLLVKDAKVDLTREDFNGLTAIQAAEKYNSQNIKKIFNKELRKQPQY